MRKLQQLAVLILLCLFTFAPANFARTGSHSSTHKTAATKRSHKKNNRPKTVHVRSYKKKNGTVVRAHDRSAPQR
jgi:hypothetical protein